MLVMVGRVASILKRFVRIFRFIGEQVVAWVFLLCAILPFFVIWMFTVLLSGPMTFALVGLFIATCIIWIFAVSPLTIQIVLIIITFILLLQQMFAVVDNRESPKWSSNPFWPISIFFNISLTAMLIFAFITSALNDHGLVKLSSTAKHGDIGVLQITMFYLWHLSDAVPLLKINESLHWSVPLIYKSWPIGALLVLFKLSIVAPGFNAIRETWKIAQSKGKSESTQDSN